MITYYLIRILTYPFGFLPFWALQITGKFLGSFLYLFLPKFRKRALSNLALAKDLNLSSREIRTTAKNSFKNLYHSNFRDSNEKQITIAKLSDRLENLLRFDADRLFIADICKRFPLRIRNWSEIRLHSTFFFFNCRFWCCPSEPKKQLD